jgi:hypothetical protein
LARLHAASRRARRTSSPGRNHGVQLITQARRDSGLQGRQTPLEMISQRMPRRVAFEMATRPRASPGLRPWPAARRARVGSGARRPDARPTSRAPPPSDFCALLSHCKLARGLGAGHARPPPPSRLGCRPRNDPRGCREDRPKHKTADKNRIARPASASFYSVTAKDPPDPTQPARAPSDAGSEISKSHRHLGPQ